MKRRLIEKDVGRAGCVWPLWVAPLIECDPGSSIRVIFHEIHAKPYAMCISLNDTLHKQENRMAAITRLPASNCSKDIFISFLRFDKTGKNGATLLKKGVVCWNLVRFKITHNHSRMFFISQCDGDDEQCRQHGARTGRAK